jgi:hypothetical protein
MKTFLTILILCVGIKPAFGEENMLVLPPEITTVSGKIYKSVRLLKTNLDSLKIAHEDGITTIMIQDLPPEIKNKISLPKSEFDFSRRAWNQPIIADTFDNQNASLFFETSAILSLPKGEFETKAERDKRIELIKPDNVYFFAIHTNTIYDTEKEEMLAFGGRIFEDGRINFHVAGLVGKDFIPRTPVEIEMFNKSKFRKSGLGNFYVKPTNLLPREIFAACPKHNIGTEQVPIYQDPYTCIFFKIKMKRDEAISAKPSLKIVCGVSFPEANCLIDEEIKGYLNYVAKGNIEFVGLVKCSDDQFNKTAPQGELLASWTRNLGKDNK